MMLEYIWVAVFASFPEALFILILGFNLSNVRNIKFSKFFIIAVIQSVIALFVRMSNVYFGFHTIIQVVSMYLLVLIFIKVKFYKAMIPVLIGFIAQFSLQSIILPIIGIIFKLEVTKLYYDSKNLVFASFPVTFTTLILITVIVKKNLILCDINE